MVELDDELVGDALIAAGDDLEASEAAEPRQVGERHRREGRRWISLASSAAAIAP